MMFLNNSKLHNTKKLILLYSLGLRKHYFKWLIVNVILKIKITLIILKTYSKQLNIIVGLLLNLLTIFIIITQIFVLFIMLNI